MSCSPSIPPMACALAARHLGELGPQLRRKFQGSKDRDSPKQFQFRSEAGRVARIADAIEQDSLSAKGKIRPAARLKPSSVEHDQSRQIQPLAERLQPAASPLAFLAPAVTAFHDRQVDRAPGATEEVAARVGRHEPAIEVAGAQTGDARRSVVPGEMGPAMETLRLHPDPAEGFQESQESRLRVSTRLNGPYGDARHLRHGLSVSLRMRERGRSNPSRCILRTEPTQVKAR